jgi:methylenetetrahydrofolate dehydrogenase (NADP+) / methenyltetrahydrofolate cyclohydrolase / formyltetrahydrofolate synthetase
LQSNLNLILVNVRSLREQVKNEITEIQKKNPRFKPGLAIVQVGDRPDSTTYVRMKGKAAQEVSPL